MGNRRLQASLDRMREAMERYPYGSTRLVHSIYVYDDEDVHERSIPTEVFERSVMHRFEDAEFPIPEDYDTYLTVLYGKNHMTPPPPMRE